MSLHEQLAKWSSVESGPFFEVDTPKEWLDDMLPKDYLALAELYGGREGFLGQQYLRLYRPAELRALNDAYGIDPRCVGFVLFGSDGYGEGFGFSCNDGSVLKFPQIPLPVEGEEEGADKIASSFDAFIRLKAATPTTLRPNPACIGMELHLKQPLCFGGDWRAPENQVLVTPGKHAELARYWNNIYRDLLAQQQGPGS